MISQHYQISGAEPGRKVLRRFLQRKKTGEKRTRAAISMDKALREERKREL